MLEPQVSVFGWVFMRSVFAAIAIGLMTAGQAAASSFVVVEEPSASPAKAPESATPADSKKSSSIIFLGEPDPTPIASAPSAKRVDRTETASVGNPIEDTSERGRIMRAWAQAEADAQWAKVTAIQSASMLYFGAPEPDYAKVAKDDARVAALDPARVPMVMRGGIFGDLSVAPARSEEQAAEATTVAPGASTARSAAQERARIEQRAREREARPSPPRPKLSLSPKEQAKILPK